MPTVETANQADTRSTKGPRRGRGGRRTLALGLALLATLAAPPALAQTTVTLVSNFSDVSSATSVSVGELTTFTHRAGQQFTTGANADGYLLKSLTFAINSRDSGSTPKVSIYTSVNDEPGSELYTFTDPSAGTGDKTVTAQANAALAASTPYFVVFEDSDTATGKWNVRQSDTFTNYDTDSLADWSLSGRIHSNDGGTTWGSIFTSEKIAIKLTGEVVTQPVVPAQTEHEVPESWTLKPYGVAAGGKFRLLFLSSTTRDATSTDIADYNTHVQTAAAAGHADIQAYSADFTAIASTGDVNARTNTLTRSTDTDVPIYWVSASSTRSAVATDYADFYDGAWGDSLDQETRTETGATHTLAAGSSSDAFTGTSLDGTSGNVLGGVVSDVWSLHSDGDGTLASANGSVSAARRFLALSPIFRVATPLVTNTGERWSGRGSSSFLAQSFTTGSNTTLTSVDIRLGSALGKSTSAKIREDNGGEPGDLVATLVNPSSLDDERLHNFAAPAGTTLTEATTYWLLMNEGVSSSRASFDWTSSDSETGESGWTIGDTFLWRTIETDAWSTASTSIILAVYGTAGGMANNAPVFDDGDDTTRSVAENTVANTNIGTAVAATDADTGDTLTYTLTGTDAASFGIDSDTGQLKTSAALDYETKDSYSVTVNVDDGNFGSDTIAVTINVTDESEQPARPIAPTVNLKAGTTDELEAFWTAPDPNGGPAITAYRRRIKPVASPSSDWEEGSTTGTSHTFTGLLEDTEYEVQVRALNGGETPSDWSPSGFATTGMSQSQLSVSFSASSYTAVEGGAAATVTVRLNRAPDAATTIPITRSNRGGASNADYSGVPSSVTFGTSNTSRSFTVMATDDDENDPGERVHLSFGTLPTGVGTGQPSTASVNIVDNDTDTARVTFDAGSTAANERAGAAPVRLRLTDGGGATLLGGLHREVSVPLTVTHIGGATAADYEPLPTSVTFAVGEAETMVRVVPVNDDDDDDGEAVRLGLGPLPAGLSAGAHPTKLVRLLDDDGIDTWYVSFEQAGYTAAEGGAVRIAVVLSDPWKPWLNQSLTIPLQVSAHGGGATSGDYSGVPESVTIPAGATRATFTVRAVDDTDDDGGESVTLAMRWQRFPDDLSAGRGPIETVVSLADDDGATPVEVSFGSAAYTAAEGGSPATVQVRLDRAPGREVRVPLTTTRRGASSGDFSGVPGSVVFGAAQTVGSFTVTATDDSHDDDGESLDIGFGTLPDAVTAGSPASATVQLEDDDGPVARYEVRFDARSSLVRDVHEGGCHWTGAALYPVDPLDAAPETSLALPLTATHLRGATAADYSDLPANLVFEAGETRSGFSVCAVDDAEEDPGEGLIVRFGALPAGVSGMRDRDAATFAIVDNDGPPGVSIGDATVRERRGSTYSRLIFTLTLDRRADVESSVGWRTVDGTATAGEDYVAASGTATIRRGNNWTQIEVETIYDEVAEGEETMTVVLSNPQALRLVDATGTGTILDARATVGVADAFVTGAQLTLRYAEALDAGSTPGPKDWVVRAESRAGARTLAVTAVAVRGTDATLTLGTPAQPAETVTMTYLPWAMHPLRASPDGPEAAPLTELPVRNDTGLPPPEASRDPSTLPAPSLAVLPAQSAASAPRRLDLLDRGLADITSLAGLTELDALDLSANALADAWPLATLSNLRRLDLSGNRVADIAPLAALAGLEVLDLSGNALSDVSALAALSNLRRLDLSGNRVADIAPLASLAGLEVLDLSGNALSDVSALAALSNLRRLDLSGNALADVTALVGLADLEVLVLDGNAIADPGALGQLRRLARLGLSANRVSEVALLTGLGSLARLDLSGNRIALPAPLGELSGLMWLDLRANPLSDVSPLGHLEQLRWLWLDPRAPGLGALAPLTEGPAPLRLDSGLPAQSDATR